jgi:hypothetical protein
MTTIGEAISRVRNLIKAVTMDSFVTDRVIYSLIQKYAKMYIKRESNIASRARFGSLFKRLPCIPLVEVDRIEACCDVKSGCTIMRTREKLPGIIEGAKDGKGRGKQVIGVARTCNLILILGRKVCGPRIAPIGRRLLVANYDDLPTFQLRKFLYRLCRLKNGSDDDEFIHIR